MQQGTTTSQKTRRASASRWAWVCALTAIWGCTGAAELRKEREEKADFHYNLANGYFQSKNIDLAIREVITALEVDAEHADAHYLYGFILFGRKQ